MTGRTGGPVLSRRALGRATLERQHLLRRVDLHPVAAVEHLAGVQAQVPAVPYTAVWNRLAGFDPEVLSAALADRTLVRSPLMRTTLHLVTAVDCLALRPLMQPVLSRTFASTAWGQRLRGPDLQPYLGVAIRLVEDRPMTRAELARELAREVPEIDADSLAMAFTYSVPLVQLPPRGLWARTAASKFTTVRSWLADVPVGAQMTPVDLVSRYLAAYGPASVPDVQAWCGLTRLREVTEGMELRRYRSEGGAELLDLPDAALPDPETPAPVRFLPEYENALLSYADRSRVIGDRPYAWPHAGPGGMLGTLLVDGFAVGAWVLRAGDPAVLEADVPGSLGGAARDAVVSEGLALCGFLAPGRTPDVRLVGA